MSKKTILIVDDEEKIRKYLDMELTTAGYDVKQAETATAAIEYAQKEMPDLIVMDIMLPDITGAEAVKILRKNEQTSSIPIIFLTAMLTRQEEETNPLGLHIEDEWYYAIAKPYDHKKLLEIIKKCLGE